MMRRIIILIHGAISSSAFAKEPIHFKEALVIDKIDWLTYGMVMMVLLLAIFLISKKYKPKRQDKALCQVIEKTYLGHKTVVYVIDYQEQRFLLADNQQTLSFCAVSLDGRDAKS